MKIGFIGLGVMGKPMSKNLIRAGYEVYVYDHHPENVDDVVSAGGQKGTSIGDVARRCDAVITMLPNSPQVKEAVLGSGGVLENLREGGVVIDMSSISPIASREISDELDKKSIDMLDAPVSGGEQGAIAGTLSIMVGGKEEVFNRFKDLLSAMGSSVVLCGSIGAGNVTKLANQVIVAINIAAVSEALTLGSKAGVSPETIFNAIKGGLAGSNVMNSKVPMILDRNFKPGFRVDLQIKDLANAIETGDKVGAPLFLTSEVMEMFRNVRVNGEGKSDHSALVKFYEKLSDTEITR